MGTQYLEGAKLELAAETEGLYLDHNHQSTL